MPLRVGICFSRQFEGNDPLGHIGVKLPVYLRLLELCQKKGWGVFVLTRRTYQGKGIFKGSWQFGKNKFLRIRKPIKIDLIYDRTGGVKFPWEEDSGVVIVNRRDFKLLCWDKWLAFKKIGQFMPQTVWVGERKNLIAALLEIKTDWVVLKPYNGLKGIGVFIGPKNKALTFEFLERYPQYIAQEFVDTSKGIPGIVKSLHDLRVAVVNGKAVWSHVRTPPPGSFKANVAQGGGIKEVACAKLPVSIKKTVGQIAKRFYKEFDNPIYCLDFGVSKDGPLIFELNDQMGFPRWEMKTRDIFLEELVENFAGKLRQLR